MPVRRETGVRASVNDASGTASTHGLVAFVLGFDADRLPAAVRHESLRGFVNALGCTVGGARHALVDRAHAALSEFAGPPVASLLGRGQRTDVLTAALLNGTAGAAYSYFDTYSDALLHPAGPIVAALLALAERTPVSGPAFLSACAAGIEVACRLTKAIAVAPAEGEMAWSQTGIACGPAAALAAGKLLGLSEQQMVGALGIAISQAAGTRASHASMAASLIFGQAAQTGLRAALLADQGFTSTDGTLEDRYGFAAVFAKKPHLPVLLAGLGEEFELMRNTYKPFPCGLVIHPAIDAMLRLRAGHRLDDSTQIERIELGVNAGAMSLGFRPDPKDDLEAKFSVQHWVAAAARHGKAGFAEGRLAVVDDPEVRRLRSIIDMQADPALAGDAATLAVTLRSGDRFAWRIEHCVGSLESPMSDADLETKFLDQVEMVIGRPRARALLAASWNVGSQPDVAVLARQAC